jgi:hypothetical protein
VSAAAVGALAIFLVAVLGATRKIDSGPVHRWADERGLTIVAIRPKRLRGTSWKGVYWVRWREASGREDEGHVVVSGLLHPKAWLDS